MAISKPYKRLYRPALNQNWMNNPTEGYQNDPRNITSGERSSLFTAARLIIQDFEDLFIFVEPTNSHLHVYSHRIYELYLRACTEIEANFKGILEANGYTSTRDFCMSDYIKIEQATHLSSYKVEYTRWSPTFESTPFRSWSTGASLKWYQRYNMVKHDRYKNFKYANMNNLMNAICGLLCLLHAQFGKQVGGLMARGMYATVVDSEEVSVSSFNIIPHTWADADKYDFNWNILSPTADAFDSFPFV